MADPKEVTDREADTGTDNLEEVDELEVVVVVNDEVDYISPSNNTHVVQPGRLVDAPLTELPEGERGKATKQLSMSKLCCGALGLSLLIVCESPSLRTAAGTGFGHG